MNKFKNKLHEIIFGTDTFAGKLFDILLILLILFSVFSVVLESVESYREKYQTIFNFLEYTFTLLFTIEYFLRVFITKKKNQYIFSFFGIVDLLAIIPSYISFFAPGIQSLLTIRAFRLIRIFRILKLSRYNDAGNILIESLKASKAKIIVFLWFVFSLAIIFGTIIYLVEGKESGFTSIPRSIYWAIVTMTTVGFGDIVPRTNFGQFLSAFLMILGYGIIAVPTGIVTAEITKSNEKKKCPHCHKSL